MNTKKLGTLIAALAIVAAIVIVANLIANRKPSDTSLAFFPVSNGAIASFVIYEKGDSARVFKKGDIWYCQKPGSTASQGGAMAMGTGTSADEGYPCDSAAVVSALEKIASMKKDVIISENPAKQAVFEVDSTGLYLECFDATGKSLGSVRVGKNGPDWTTNYVRKMGSDKVYSVSGSVRYAYYASVNRWRDKSILKFDKNAAKNITIIKQGGNQFSVSRVSDTTADWKLNPPDSGLCKTEEMDKILNTATALSATDWADDPALNDSAMGFTQPQLVMIIVLKNGDQKEITIGGVKNGSKDFYVRAKGKSGTFIVGDFAVANFDKKAADLNVNTVTPPTPAQPEKEKPKYKLDFSKAIKKDIIKK